MFNMHVMSMASFLRCVCVWCVTVQMPWSTAKFDRGRGFLLSKRAKGPFVSDTALTNAANLRSTASGLGTPNLCKGPCIRRTEACPNSLPGSFDPPTPAWPSVCQALSEQVHTNMEQPELPSDGQALHDLQVQACCHPRSHGRVVWHLQANCEKDAWHLSVTQPDLQKSAAA